MKARTKAKRQRERERIEGFVGKKERICDGAGGGGGGGGACASKRHL